MVWRNIENDRPGTVNALNFMRCSDLGYGTDVYVDGGLRRFKMGFWPSGTTPGGSGATLTDWFTENMFRFCIHEFGHYLLGGNEQHQGYGFWGLCSGWGIKNFVANSYERYRLGWINLNTINPTPDSTIFNATFPDFVSSGIAYRLNINESSNEYFYLENHQKISFWENNQMFLRNAYGNVENGIYILRQDGSNGRNIQILPADGRFNWTVNQLTPNPWGLGDLPVFKLLDANRVNGYHDLQLIPWTWNGVPQAPHAIHFTENKAGETVLDVRYYGDGKDGFRMDYNEVWSPFSNPNSQKGNKTSTPFGIKLNSVVNCVVSCDIYMNTSLSAPPSKPTGLRISVNGQFQPVLNWVQNIEPDMKYSGQYKIFRCGTTGGEPTNFTHVATIDAYDEKEPITTWTDPNMFVGQGPDKLFYKISAVDNSAQESMKSDYDWIAYDHTAQKIISKTGFEMDYSLDQNYPNPFNPVTNIHFTVKDAGRVQIKVYDILGNEIQTLFDQFREVGSYVIRFDAGNLTSGVYIYTIKVNDFVQTRKMTLLR